MALEVGSRLGHYDVTALIGEGGMGQVYQATDTKLKRQVALKILPEAFSADPERLARFQREAEVLASLNHPNIAAIHGLEEADGIRALVLELVEGPTLADRIKRGPIPLDEALPIAKQIAEALEAAHEKGIIHRDLKPANIKVRDDGTVKVLDFGLAKALDPTPDGDPSESPTLTAMGTQMGVIMGTAAYMSPEQAAGRTADRQSDIWSFGVVLFEMLTGQRLFTGETVSHVLASVLKTEPDWSILPTNVQPSLLRVLRRCLGRDRRDRLHDIADARLEITDLQADRISEPLREPTVSRPATGRSALLIGVGALLVGSAATALLFWGLVRIEPPPVRRLVVDTPDLTFYQSFAVSPDGQTLVFIARRNDVTQLYRRTLDRFEPQPISGTEGSSSSVVTPFFSPDGQWIGYGQDETLRKVPLAGGEPVVLCDVPGNIAGAMWGPDDVILFGDYDGLSQVSARGGVARRVTSLGSGDTFHANPHLLPDGKALLFDVLRDGQWRVAVRSLETEEQRELFDGSHPYFARTGHLLFERNSSLWAVPFDVSRLDVTGEPRPVVEDVHSQEFTTVFSVSQSGVLVFAPAQPVRDTLVRVDLEGQATPLATAEDLWYPRVAPDGRSVAVGINQDIWIMNVEAMDVERTTRQRLTFDQTVNGYPFSWSPDGAEVVFAGPDARSFYRVRADGSGRPELLLQNEQPGWPTSWGADHQAVVFHVNNPGTKRDLWMWHPDDGTSSPFFVTPFEEKSASFSPDGRWVAYVSDESGQDEVYVQPYPGPGPKVTVSTDGGTEPVWSVDGRQLFYRRARQVLAVEVAIEPTFALGQARVLFESPRCKLDVGNAQSNPNYDVFPDASAFVMIEEGAALPRLHVVLNWFQELTERVPVN